MVGSTFARRATLYQRQREGFRRRTVRIASRATILLVADLVALVAARALAGGLMLKDDLTPAPLRDFESVGPLADPGSPASLVFWIFVIPALVATGSYSRHRGLNTTIRLGAAAILAGAAAILPLAAVLGWQRAVIGTTVIAAVVLLSLRLGRLGAEAFLQRVWPRDRGAARALLIGPADAAESRVTAAVTAGGGDYMIVAHHVVAAPSVGEMEVPGPGVELLIKTHAAEAVILTETLPNNYLRGVVDHALAVGCLVLSPAHAIEVDGLEPRLVWHHDQPLFEFDTPVLQLSALFTKRLMDVMGSAVLLTLLSPAMVVIAAAVKLGSPGPVFFSQARAGLGGRKFRMIKFRTMRSGADDEKSKLSHLNHTGDVRLFKIKEDPRVTKVGEFLRRWSLDELPQFWNVLRGDMSLVGPRPFFESDFAAYEDHHFRRLDTKPGITGLWQVGGRSDVVNFEDVVYLDRKYIEEWSVWLDLGILLRTIPSVIRRTGAY